MRQSFREGYTVAQTVVDEVHRAPFVWARRSRQRLPGGGCGALAAFSATYLQFFLAADAVHALAVDRETVTAKQHVQTRISESRTLHRELLQAIAQSSWIRPGRSMASHGPGKPHEAALVHDSDPASGLGA